jgi:hypothetical protein
MAGGHPGIHGLGDGAKLGQHFADRYTGLQWKPWRVQQVCCLYTLHVYCLFTVQLYWLFMVQVIRKKNLNQKYSGFSYLSSSVSLKKLFLRQYVIFLKSVNIEWHKKNNDDRKFL